MSTKQQKKQTTNSKSYVIKLIKDKNIKKLSELKNIENDLIEMYRYKKFNSIATNYIDLTNLLNNIKNEKDAKAKEDAKAEEKAISDQVSQEKATSEQKEKEADTTLFEAKLKEMEDKLPLKLGKAVSGLDYTQVADKEFCYKFLYCWLNNQDNQRNPNAIKVYKSIIDTYGIEDDRFPKSDIDNQAIEDFVITFDVGFIINIEPVKGGSPIPTQKRRPNKPKKRNRTIKDRVKTR